MSSALRHALEAAAATWRASGLLSIPAPEAWDARVAVWADDLDRLGWSAADVAEAGRLARTGSRYWPTLAELIAYGPEARAGGDADVAWRRVLALRGVSPVEPRWSGPPAWALLGDLDADPLPLWMAVRGDASASTTDAEAWRAFREVDGDEAQRRATGAARVAAVVERAAAFGAKRLALLEQVEVVGGALAFREPARSGLIRLVRHADPRQELAWLRAGGELAADRGRAREALRAAIVANGADDPPTIRGALPPAWPGSDGRRAERGVAALGGWSAVPAAPGTLEPRELAVAGACFRRGYEGGGGEARAERGGGLTAIGSADITGALEARRALAVRA